MRTSDQLPDDVGTVFVTDVPGSWIQAYGRRAYDHLWVGGGAIVNCSSFGRSRRPAGGEYAPRGIRINAVWPRHDRHTNGRRHRFAHLKVHHHFERISTFLRSSRDVIISAAIINVAFVSRALHHRPSQWGDPPLQKFIEHVNA